LEATWKQCQAGTVRRLEWRPPILGQYPIQVGMRDEMDVYASFNDSFDLKFTFGKAVSEKESYPNHFANFCLTDLTLTWKLKDTINRVVQKR
jgi:hypothetical protein